MNKTTKGFTYLILIFAIAGLFSCSPEKGRYVDGQYSGTYDFLDGHGWKPFLDVVIKGGKITEANFDYRNGNGDLKTKDEKYQETMNKVSKTYPAKYSKELAEQLIAKQAGEVDIVTGATTSSKYFNQLSQVILDKALKGDKSVTVLPMNATYTASDAADERGYIATVKVTYENGNIVKVAYDEADKDKKLKRDSEYVNTEMLKVSGISFKDAAIKLEESLTASQDPDKVDAVTGATSMSKRFIALAKEAVAKRK